MKPETVVLVNRVYCYCRVVFWMLTGLGCFWARGNTHTVYVNSQAMFESLGYSEQMLVGLYSMVGILAFVLAILNVGLANAPQTRKWWTAHVVNQIMGTLECCCLPLGLPLAILFMSPAVKALFPVEPGRAAGPDPTQG